MEYRNFDVWIGAAMGGGYQVRAQSQTQGEAQARLALDPASPALKHTLARLADRDTDEDMLVEFGEFLYNALFTGDVESLLQVSWGEVIGDDALGLRIRLRIDPPDLAVIPWEYLYSPKRERFLGASLQTPLVRYLDVFQPIPVRRTTLPLKVLVAAPAGSGLEVETEKRYMQEALSALGDMVEIRWLEGKVTRGGIADALQQERFHVFHFIGHGLFEDGRGYLVIDDEDGGEYRLSERVFARLFIDEPSITLVMLNACQGATASATRPMAGVAAKLVERGIPAVVAHQYSIWDDAAICFAREFYRRLCKGADAGHVDAAVARARNRLSIEFPDQRSLGAPVLFMRAPDGLIFDISRPAAPDQPPVSDRPLPLDPEELAHQKRLLESHRRNVRILEEQLAKMGTFASPYMISQLEDEKEAIAKIEGRIDAMHAAA